MTEVIKLFEPISLEQMSGVKLMNRTDTKFVTTTERLQQLLQMAQNDYYVQEIDGERNLEYDTTYFDTKQFDMRTSVHGGQDKEQPRTHEEETHRGQGYGCVRTAETRLPKPQPPL